MGAVFGDAQQIAAVIVGILPHVAAARDGFELAQAVIGVAFPQRAVLGNAGDIAERVIGIRKGVAAVFQRFYKRCGAPRRRTLEIGVFGDKRLRGVERARRQAAQLVIRIGKLLRAVEAYAVDQAGFLPRCGAAVGIAGLNRKPAEAPFGRGDPAEAVIYAAQLLTVRRAKPRDPTRKVIGKIGCDTRRAVGGGGGIIAVVLIGGGRFVNRPYLNRRTVMAGDRAPSLCPLMSFTCYLA